MKFNKKYLCWSIGLIFSFQSNIILASCNDTDSSFLVTSGSQCTATRDRYAGLNVGSVFGDGSTLTFLQPTVTIDSDTNASTHAFGIGYRSGGENAGEQEPGATVYAKNLNVLSSYRGNARGIYIFSDDTNKPNILNVSDNLYIYHRNTLVSGSALELVGVAGEVHVGQNMTLKSDIADALRNAGTINIGNELDITSGLNAITNSGNINVSGKTTLTINQGNGIYNKNNGTIYFLDNVSSNGEDTAINNDNSTINFFGDFNSFDGRIINTNGLINLSNDVTGGILSAKGDYTGDNGVLKIDTEFKDDNSKTDKIIIGGTATGSTELQIVNAGGGGAQTVNGIHVIQTGSSESNQTFYLDGGAVSVGAYDYRLNLKKAGTDTNTTTFDNWYLESQLKQRDIEVPMYTPDVGEYLAVETMGNTLFTSRLEDREGASQYQKLGNNDTGNVWVRAYGGHNQFKSVQDQLKTKGNSFVTQIGTGLVTLGEEDQYNLGAMTGFATYDGKTRSNLTDRESKTKINGYSLGLYGTWYAHPVEKRGAYIDSWVLWNKFNNKIDTPDQNQYKYDSSGITASIEAGGDYLLNKNGKKDWWIQPQAQLIYQGVHADDFKDAQNVDINHGRDNLQARMGVKTYLNIPTNGSKLTSYRPYVALNFIHNTNPYSVVIDDVRYENEGSANLGEFKLGVEGQVTKNSQVWLNASYVAGSHDNQAYQGNIGWKYNF